nr:ribonuclease H-like domain-containing protein [Tanacetum cinerariifolium]
MSPSLISCLSSLGESLLYVTVADGQSLGVLQSLSTASESGSHATVVVFGSVYSATVVVPGVPEVGTPVHILARGGSEAHDVLSGLTLPIEPKPRGQHRPPLPRSILSPGGCSPVDGGDSEELKFNLFCVSQMCDKKNSVLFTTTQCLILSPEFKLPDENQVLLRVPKENNMYNVNLKNIVPSGDLTCLFSKATLDESNL